LEGCGTDKIDKNALFLDSVEDVDVTKEQKEICESSSTHLANWRKVHEISTPAINEGNKEFERAGDDVYDDFESCSSTTVCHFVVLLDVSMSYI